MRDEYVDLSFDPELSAMIRVQAKIWFPKLPPRKGEQKTVSRLLNIGVRHIQENPQAMQDFLDFLDS